MRRNSGSLLKTLLALLVTASATVWAGSVSAVTLQISGTELTGALNVDVNGTLYDVAFLEGSCIGLFAGCTSFTFTTSADALAAAQALLDTVFLDVGAGAFDSIPSLTFGCESLAYCAAVVPYGVTVGYADVALAFNVPSSDSASSLSGEHPATDYSDFSGHVWATFTPASTVPVPATVPGTLGLLGVGLAVLGFARRTRSLT
jgi:hypothetical protein